MKHYLTSESVCQGHPDKLCDYIADSILDACLSSDAYSRVACEVMATKGRIIVAGEITSRTKVNIRQTVRTALAESGYNPKEFTISVFLHNQSSDIAGGVDTALEIRDADGNGDELGAGDQGTVYGYATDETPSGIPLPLELSHRICRTLDEQRKSGTILGIRSDGKAQVSVEYEDGKPKRVAAIIVSVQHARDKNLDTLKGEIIKQVLYPACSDFPFDAHTRILINPSGRFVEGGPAADTGLTGRKIMVDTYGGLALHGGGAFSGKDATKVDRSGAYMARMIAKNIVAAESASRCEVAISYAIGKAEPVAVNVHTFATGKVDDEKIAEAVRTVFSLKPRDIIDQLGLRSPVYNLTSCYGHFGNALFAWEQVSERYIEALKGELEQHD
ncbi:MAG: methionine adenosyltransferase [Spirochaetae bacterium HGW-Spirochaetae-8]|nr:MAG: methionine adenosyltransferase [Spirochaetae bacterium HGW-Spirochaetae-8]